MSIDFPLILVSLTALCAIIWGIDALFFARQRRVANKKMPVVVDYARSFFPVFLIVLMIRSFIVSPFRVPSGSLEPTILPNDFVLVNHFSYGLKLPVLNTKILKIGEPKLGDIVVFRFPGDTSVDYVKRLIGVPGDHVVYKNKQLFINGKAMPQKYLKEGIAQEPGMPNIPVQVKAENLNGVRHNILIQPEGGSTADYDIVVPKGYYFMMGDNRDGSADSRYWGFVPEKNIIGKAFLIWLSWDSQHYRVRWSRIGTVL